MTDENGITECIILDLDGTLCNVDHRVEYALTKQYDEFHSRLSGDKPNPAVQAIIRLLAVNLNILVVTGRNAKWRTQTERWLTKHGIIVDDLLMRPDDDFTKDHELKLLMIERHFGSKEAVLKNVVMALEDRDQVVEAFRNYGIPTWQVVEGAY